MTIQYDNLNTTISAVGSATNIDINLTPKGTTGFITVVPSAGWVSGQVARINLGDAGSNLKSTASTGKATLSGFDGVEISSRGSSPILQLNVPHTASAVNYVQVTGAATGVAPVVSAQGSDTNIDLALTPKGTGNVRFGTYTASMVLTVQGYIEVKDAGGTIRKLAVIA